MGDCRKRCVGPLLKDSQSRETELEGTKEERIKDGEKGVVDD